MLSSKFSKLFRLGTLCGVLAMLVLVTGCPPQVPCTDDAECDDGLFCNGVETCDPDASVCMDGTAPCVEGEVCNEEMDRCEACGNEGQAVCDDADLCTNDACVDGMCVFTAVDCDDADACTADSCDAATGDCVNAAIDCDDADPCTDDSCDPATGCVNAPMDCDDGDACTDDSCVDGVCVHTVIDCDDADLCTDDSCDPATGCVNTLIAECVDGDLCTQDLCADGVCSNPPVECPEGEQCDPATGECAAGCTADADCDDGDACTDDACVDNECVFTPVDCPSGKKCVGGDCVEIVCTGHADCDDGIACTTDSCNIATNECIYANVNELCWDTLFCTGPDGADVCDPAHPDAGADGCVRDGDPCPATITTPICNDTDDVCEKCDPDDETQCDDGLRCTIDTCLGTGACQNAPENANCPDAVWCDGIDICDPLNPDADDDGCVAPGDRCAGKPCDEVGKLCFNCRQDSPPDFASADCDDGLACTDDECPDEGVGVCVNVPVDANCPDPDYCDGVDWCMPGDPNADANGCLADWVDPCPFQACDDDVDACFDCLVNEECDDGIDCTNDWCDQPGCDHADNCAAPLTCNLWTGECE